MLHNQMHQRVWMIISIQLNHLSFPSRSEPHLGAYALTNESWRTQVKINPVRIKFDWHGITLTSSFAMSADCESQQRQNARSILEQGHQEIISDQQTPGCRDSMKRLNILCCPCSFEFRRTIAQHLRPCTHARIQDPALSQVNLLSPGFCARMHTHKPK